MTHYQVIYYCIYLLIFIFSGNLLGIYMVHYKDKSSHLAHALQIVPLIFIAVALQDSGTWLSEVLDSSGYYSWWGSQGVKALFWLSIPLSYIFGRHVTARFIHLKDTSEQDFDDWYCAKVNDVFEGKKVSIELIVKIRNMSFESFKFGRGYKE